MIIHSKKYYLQCRSFDKESIVLLSKDKVVCDKTKNWEKEIYKFILEWFDDKDYIKVNTSGSTGTPKTISLKKTHMVASAKATLYFLGLKEGDKALLCLPANYIAGKMMIVRALTGGLNLHYVQPLLNPDFSQNKKFKLIAVVPSMLSDTLKSGSTKELEKFENILVGGSDLSKKDENKLMVLNNNIWHTYGMTETITHIALRRINGIKRSDWFTPLRDVNISISEDGTLIINYNNIGVIKLITNDIVEIKQDSDFKIFGRKDNVIISGGLKIHPEVLEKKIDGIIENKHFIHGIYDEKLGQKVVLFIEGEIEISKNDILSQLAQKLTHLEMPKEIIIVRKFERTESEKIIRKLYQ